MEPTRDARARALPWTRQGDDPPGPRNTRSDACKADASALAGLAGKGRSLASLAGYGLKKLWQDVLCRRQWYLAIRPGNGDPLRKGFATEPFRPLIPKDKTGWADPFLVRHGGRTWRGLVHHARLGACGAGMDEEAMRGDHFPASHIG